ncbi:MAG TPA: FAD binding domain-containing protein [Candidatus Limnocylindrales bacterium]|nr:FAD binding domain-containing protein [Candidatus Limnocylindrales bacterium]
MTASLPATGAVRLTVNGRPVEAAVDGGRRLLDLLRLDLGLTGTKEGCGEGECGACAVLLDGELVNSCLVPVGQAAGRDVLTIEGLAADGRLAPVQASFLELGGTQCGICTPGMLLAAHAHLASRRPSGDADIREAIAGNLCRCTGYTKILEAIEAVADDGVPGAILSPGGAAPTPVAVGPGSTGAEPALVRATSLPDALSRLAAHPTLRAVAGGTDLMVETAMDPARRRPLLDLSGLDELRGITVAHDELVLGALTSWEELRRSPFVHAALPVLAEVATSMGAVAIRNRATIGGNCVTASPAGDLLPVLLATDARLEIAGRRGTRTVPANAFWTGYRRTALEPGEVLVAIRIPLVPGRVVRFRKVGTRRALAIAKVLVAAAWIEGDGEGGDRGVWRDVRVALGSVAERPVRAAITEAVLEGRIPTAALAAEAAAAVEAEITPIDDVRSTAAYRRAVTGRVLRRIVTDEIR